jgi:hypothetical protein
METVHPQHVSERIDATMSSVVDSLMTCLLSAEWFREGARQNAVV